MALAQLEELAKQELLEKKEKFKKMSGIRIKGSTELLEESQQKVTLTRLITLGQS